MPTTAEILKVAATSNPTSVAGAIAGIVRREGCVELHAIGAGALAQAIKGVAIARGHLAPGGIDIYCVPSFVDLECDGQERTGIRLYVEILSMS